MRTDPIIHTHSRIICSIPSLPDNFCLKATTNSINQNCQHVMALIWFNNNFHSHVEESINLKLIVARFGSANYAAEEIFVDNCNHNHSQQLMDSNLYSSLFRRNCLGASAIVETPCPSITPIRTKSILRLKTKFLNYLAYFLCLIILLVSY